ncbi:MAG: methylmalonyl-CoA mutase family protein, partial [Candidatus Cloacimonadaceae bacterium]|nr:methylmalonyl-CoA mutase family protein [Candidatus Cloacimonadaceae bacterium]
MENDKTSNLNLSTDFPPSSWEEWLDAVKDTLKGADFDKVMQTKTYEGITLKPIYRNEDLANLKHLDSLPGETPFVRGNKAMGYLEEGWFVAQTQDNPDCKAQNEELLYE